MPVDRDQCLDAAPDEISAQFQSSSLPLEPPRRIPASESFQYTRDRGAQDGLSAYSRFVGEDLSEFVDSIFHTAQTVTELPAWTAVPYYIEVQRSLPFSSQRQLLLTICRLTLGCGSFTCRITLDLLSAASGIRNPKTLRKWLADLQKREHIRYIPIHGDLRGSVIEITPPATIRHALKNDGRVAAGSFLNY